MADERRPGIRPRPTLGRRLDVAARLSFPACTSALLLLLASAPLGLPGQPELQTASGLGCVFFWSLFRPASMPPPVVFLLGLLSDLLSYAPPGVGVLTLLAVHGLALRWRRGIVPMGFVPVWLCFVGLASMAAAMQWALTSLLTFQLLPASSVLFQSALGAGLYPLLAVLLTLAHQSLADPANA